MTASGKSWTGGNLPDTLITVAGQEMAFGARSAGFRYENVAVEQTDRRLQLNATFDLSSPALRVTRHYRIVSGTPTFEAWTTFESTSGRVELSDLNAARLVLAAGTIHWLTGLEGDNAGVEMDDAFTRQQVDLPAGQQWSIGATGRASEKTVPWFAIDGGGAEFYAALMWSGAWSARIDRAGNTFVTTIGLAPMTTTLANADASIDGPHVVFGAVAGGLTEATAALRSYILNGLRDGRPLKPLVTYNTWFAYGTEVDQESMMTEMDRVAALGTELFVIDAGWYAGAGAAGPGDFDAGLGSWTPDPVKFPNGLTPLRDHAHELGMKFGVWVEPERVNLSMLDAAGHGDIDESWLATAGGEYGSDHAGQICLANDAARAYIVARLSALIDALQPDYLKWDNNMWVNCDRGGHGHGAADGNFAHVNALYDILSKLRESYPDLLIENVSGGGNRLDLGMLRYTDAAWMDDRTAPSVHVRHNLEGLSAVFPPAYLLSFVTDHGGEPLHDSPDLSLYFRSRMAGALGLCFRSESFSDSDVAGIAHEIDIYKAMRDTLSQAAGALLTKQA
ncbi:MAG TPA: glycoside hydrolase family 36 protein, partial [Vicinamibacterales bacterium]|nr:glycoside hydrolase family 36 protein [Vicinamibacterales bacterium]